MLYLLGVVVVLLLVSWLVGLALSALVGIAITGIVIGGLARLVIPGRQNIGLFPTIGIGWLGSIVGGFVGNHMLHTGYVLTILVEIGVAAAMIAVYAGSQARSLPGRHETVRW